MEWLRLGVEAASALALTAGALIIYFVYRFQRHDGREAVQREVRARLQTSYANFHAQVMNSKHMLAVSSNLLWRDYSEAQAEQIHYLYLMLNALHLEWHCCKEHGHDRSAFMATLDALVGRLARNDREETRFLIDKIDILFSDFPADFMEEVKKCIKANLPKPVIKTVESGIKVSLVDGRSQNVVEITPDSNAT